jgi:hypothetical protein
MKHFAALVVVLLAVWAFAPAAPIKPPVTPPTTGVAAVLAKATSADKARVQAFYGAVADVVERDQKLIATVGGFRRVHANSLDLAFKGTDLPGKYAGLDVAIEEALVKAIGKEDVALTPEKRQALIAALKEVARDAR